MENIELLKRLKKSVNKKIIPYQIMTSWSRQNGEGYNSALMVVPIGLNLCI